ncbi:hypothetical protein QQ991_03135 [Weizmannia coagulans]|uniref:Uncharacterized protein n=2 Tax=Heyndrickxia TaxID=2837504 RepID=A0AAN0WE27_HEYCO|nr:MULTISPECIES: hypothetical protein [Heyndrickxia]AJO24808.1 hypothetical protein SB48_HM08orf06343 [Heyndrickxia coagulans]MCR4445420.1 hypothetical protein [Heyndrickxia coagulans]MCU6438317.1 hypothetical protein [Heyndrickxia coagulans]MCW8781506.1 hypothetical protein [Heyndrickxia coagulans]MDL4843812.1 hypothetical protein [Heyndrickxia coagulans]
MSAQAVFKQMRNHFLKTGEIMQGAEFTRKIAMRYDVDSVIDGLLMFNRYLDEQRKEVG